jgi:hypothetical protein
MFEYEKTVEYWLSHAAKTASPQDVVEQWNRSSQECSDFVCQFVIENSAISRSVSVHASPVTSSSGEHIDYVGTLEDISEREPDRRQQSALNQSFEERSQLDAVRHSVLRFGRSPVYVNPAFTEMIGVAGARTHRTPCAFPYRPSKSGRQSGMPLLRFLKENRPSRDSNCDFKDEPENALTRR